MLRPTDVKSDGCSRCDVPTAGSNTPVPQKRCSKLQEAGQSIEGRPKRSKRQRVNYSRAKRWEEDYEGGEDEEEDDMMQQAIKNSLAFEKRTKISTIPSAPSFYPTESEFKDPIRYISSLHKIGTKYGAVKIVPPNSWKPELNIDFKTFTFQTRIQRINRLQEGEGWPGGKKYVLADYKTMADEFAKKYNEANLETIERSYWDIVNGKAGDVTVEYGNDIDSVSAGSGFRKDDPSPWNLTKIARHPGSPLSFIEDIKGVTVPWVYCGMLFSSFCWHCEDNYLPSINYLHRGKPKVWYVVPSKEAPKLEKTMKQHLPCLFEREPDLIHKLCTTLDPTILAASGISVSKLVQTEASFVVTFPRGFHSGFNTGFNIAEAVNMSYEEWFSFGRKCCREYRVVGRPSVFSHDQLLIQWFRQNRSRTILDEIETTLRLQKRWTEGFLAKGMSLSLYRYMFNPAHHQCSLCSHHLYLAFVGCKCRPGAVYCMEHCGSVCDCRWNQRVMHHSFEFDGLMSAHGLNINQTPSILKG